MAYICTHVQDDSSYTPYMDAMFTTLSGAGWELYDDINSTKKVYRSKGENGAYCYGYMFISLEATYNIELRMYQDWDISTHVGIAGTYYSPTDAKTPLNLHKPLIIYCNKNLIFIFSTQGAAANTYNSKAGMLENVFDTTLTTTVSGISAGSSVTIPVKSSAGFLKGARYKIVGTHQEGREVVIVGSIPDNTSVVVASLSYTYASGTYFGKEPCPIITQNNYNGIVYYGFGYSTFSIDDGTSNQTGGSSRYDLEPILTTSMLDPNDTYSLYGLAPMQYYEYSAYTYIGYMDNVFYAPIAMGAMTAYDGVYLNGDLYLLLPTPIYTVASATSNTVTLTAVSFDTNEFQNKIIVISIGNSAGHTRKIISNTSDTITVETDWYISVNQDDSVIICDEVYRPFGYNCYKEII